MLSNNRKHLFDMPTEPTKRKPRKNTEQIEHEKFVRWAKGYGLAVNHAPGELLGVVVALLGGKGYAIAAKAKRMGIQAGFPDLQIVNRVPNFPEIRSVAIEFKSKVGKESPDQAQVRKVLEREGWLCAVCRSAEEAQELATSLWPNKI